MPKLHFNRLGGGYAVAQLAPQASVPDWWDGDGFASVSRSETELSVVCRSERVPKGVTADFGWVAFALMGPYSFSETGVVLSIVRPLSENGIGVFVVSTFSGDCLLIKEEHVERGCRYLQAAGHRVD